MIAIKFVGVEVRRMLKILPAKQLPFAMSRAINSTAFNVQAHAKKQLPIKLDRPAPYTLKALKVVTSTKARLTANVHIQANRWSYLKDVVEGGTRVSRGGKNIAIPTGNQKLNKYGNVPGRRRGIIKKGYFFATMPGRNTEAVFKRVGKKRLPIKKMYSLSPSVTYSKKLYNLHKIAHDEANKVFPANWKNAMNYALATMK